MQRSTWIMLGVLVALAAGGGWMALRAWDPGRGSRAERLAPVARGEGNLRPSSPAVAPRAGEEAQTRTALAALVSAERAEGAASGESATHVLRGRVLDEARSSVGGAQVELRVSGLEPAFGVSAADGAYELFATLPAAAKSALVLAHDGRGAAGRVQVSLGAAQEDERLELEVAPLVLQAAYSLRVRVHSAGAPVGDALVRVELGHARLRAFEHATDARGEVELQHLPRGPVYLQALTPGREGRARAFVPEQTSASIELVALGEAEVRIVDAASGRPVAGATVVVRETIGVPAALPGELVLHSGEHATRHEHATLTTDAEGSIRISGLRPASYYGLYVRAPGYETFPRPPSSGPRIEAGAEPVEVELTPLGRRDVRWPIVAGEVGIPPDGAAIELRHAPGTLRPGEEDPALPLARMEGSVLVAQDIPVSALIARAPDGALASLRAPSGADIGIETSFRRPRRIEVIVRDAAGAPVEGVQAVARDRGNRDLGRAVETDAEGRALLEGLYGELATVSVSRPGPAGFRRDAGEVDLAAGDGRIEVTLPGSAAMAATLAIVIDGQRRLPSHFRLRMGGGHSCLVVREDPGRGELGLEVRGAAAGTTARIHLEAPGYVTATVELELPADGSPAFGEARLEKSATLSAQVRGARSNRVQIMLEHFDEAAQAWQMPPGFFSAMSRPNGPGGTYVFQGITPGRWRVVDRSSGSASSEAELLAGQQELHVELELGSAQWVSGRIVVEDPAELARARVLVEGLDVQAPGQRWMPAREPPEGAHLHSKEGDFRLRIPGDRAVRIVPWHPWLVPAVDGTVELREGRDDVVLRLVAGDELRFSSPQLAQVRRVRSLRIARFAAEAGAQEGEPLAWHHAPLDGEAFRCALPAGRWTLWIDPGAELAPLVLRGVEIEGITELSSSAFERGSALRVHVRVPEDQAPPRIYVVATALDGLPLFRDLNSQGEAEVVLPGLVSGRYRVQVSTIRRGIARELEVELDGRSDHPFELDLR